MTSTELIKHIQKSGVKVYTTIKLYDSSMVSVVKLNKTSFVKALNRNSHDHSISDKISIDSLGDVWCRN